MDGQRAEQERRPAGTGRHVPQPHRAGEAAARRRDEGEPVGRQPAFAQPLGGLGEARLAEAAVEQRLACGDVGGTFMANGDHGGSNLRVSDEQSGECRQSTGARFGAASAWAAPTPNSPSDPRIRA